MAIPAGLLKALTAVTGKAFKESDFFEGEGEDKKPISSDIIEKSIKEAYKAKHDGLDKISDEKIEKAKQTGRKEVYDKIEAEAKDLGVEMKYNEDGLSKFDEFYKSQVKNTKIDPNDVKKSEAYLKIVGELKAEKASSKQLIAKHANERMFDKLNTGTMDILSKEENKFIIPKNESVRDNYLKSYHEGIKSARYNGQDVHWKLHENSVVPVDSDGHPFHDDQGNEVSAKTIKLNTLKGFFDTSVAQQRGGAGAGAGGRGAGSAAKVFEYVMGGESKKFEMPKWENKKAGMDWLVENSLSLDQEVVTAVRTEIDSLSE